jgi:hypothetical protein
MKVAAVLVSIPGAGGPDYLLKVGESYYGEVEYGMCRPFDSESHVADFLEEVPVLVSFYLYPLDEEEKVGMEEVKTLEVEVETPV